jgi:hypothetical protein
MGRLLKFLFGLTIGAGAALLVTPKTGREVRGMLSGSQVRGLMPARLAELSRPRDYSEPEGAATAVAEPPAPVAEPKREFFVAPKPVVEAEPVFVPEPVVEAEVEPEPVVEAGPEPVAEAEPVFVPEPVVEAEAEPVVEAEPEPVVEAEPVFVPEPVVEAEAEPEPVVEAEPEPVVEAEAEPVVEAEAEPVVEAEAEPVVEAEAEPVVEAEAEPVVEAEAEPEPVVEAEPEPVAPDEDLRARIEETKADVATEIQKPFQVAEEPTAAPALEPVVAPAVEAEPEPDRATLEANLGFVGASSALEEPGERSAGFADESPGAIDISAVVSDDSAPHGETPPADVPASEAPIVTLVPESQTPVADSQPAPSYDVWPADPVPATFEPELVEEPAAESASAEPVAPEATEAPVTSEAPVAAEPLEAPVEPVVAEAPVVAEPVEIPVAPVEAEPVVAEAPVEAEPVVAEAPVAAESLRADESAPEEPGDEVPLGNIDQAEMRRRIEETRARLKAKAFDAMMSGEAALLARDSGEKPVPRGADVPVDHDVAETLDESLSQDDY